MSTPHLLGQLVVSLAVVLALMWIVARVLRRAGGGRGTVTLEVVARKQLTRTASVSVVRIGQRALVLGVTENTVTMLAETGLDDFDLVEHPADPVLASKPRRLGLAKPNPAQEPASPLAGSIVSPATWRQTVEVLRERTARRG